MDYEEVKIIKQDSMSLCDKPARPSSTNPEHSITSPGIRPFPLQTLFIILLHAVVGPSLSLQ